MWLKICILEYQMPRVDNDAACCPLAVLIEEECKVVFILTVEVFLIAHSSVVVSFYKECVVLQRN